jgi:segregation and condensation protein A
MGYQVSSEATSIDDIQPATDSAAITDPIAETAMPRHQQEEMPFAVVQGKEITTVPKDLYIPPDALEVILEAFEGPLDLLLYLIRRQNLM